MKNIIKRIVKLFQDPRRLIKKVVNNISDSKIKRLVLRFPSEDDIKKTIEACLGRYINKPAFIFPAPSCPWGYLFQRPQQIASTLARCGFPVIYCVDVQSYCEPDWSVRGLKQLHPNMFLFNDGNYGNLLSKLNVPSVIWQYWPLQNKSIRNLVSNCVYVYDCIDDLSTFQQYDDLLIDHEESLHRANVVLATSDLIFKKIYDSRPDVILVPNGVCYEDFGRPERVFWPKLERLRNKSKVLVGYYGAIAEWMDFDLIYYCAKQFPEWNFLLVGQVYPNVTIEQKELFNTNNIEIWPRQDYDRLPYLLSKFDITIVPFKINQITMCTSPVKIFEYMAGGKPVVSTDLPECRKYTSVLIAKSKEEFAQRLEDSLKLKNDESFINELFKEARNNTWEARVSTVLCALKSKGLI
ncbi:MAG: glycosyltransferase [Syntrophomonadaceae bacterium]|nr:glycosyltransferase [Syntrophomonadaceae bacterium]